jgi:hypothetical protein
MKKRQRNKFLKKAQRTPGASRELRVSLENAAVLLAIESWRIKKLVPEFRDNKKSLVLGSSIDKIIEALAREGVEVEDVEGTAFRDGMTLDVALFESTDRLSAGERVVSETLSPSVYLNGKLTQPGRVIVSVGKRKE